MQHSAILENTVSNLYANFEYDWFWNEKAILLLKSDDNNKNNNVGSAWGPVSTSMNCVESKNCQ